MNLLRWWLVALIVVTSRAVTAGQGVPAPSDPASPTLTVTGLLSVLAEGKGTRTVYLRNGLGGVGPGIAASVQFPVSSRALLGGEVGIASIKGHQIGRLLPNGGGDVWYHETWLSLLGSVRLPTATPSDLVAGAGWSFGKPDREIRIDNVAGPTFTVGLDVVGQGNPRFAVVPTARYSYLRRGKDNRYAGLGAHEFRIGAGVRFGPLRRTTPPH